MMNVLALGLILTTLATAGVFSPAKPKEDVIVKEGHRVVVVEYEKDDGNTKVLISPPDYQPDHTTEDDKTAHKFNPKEFVCDAYGKCKRKIASAVGKTEDAGVDTIHKAQDTVHGAKDTISDATRKAQDSVKDAKESMKESAAGKVKDTISGATHKAHDSVHEAKESVKSTVRDAAHQAKENVKEEGKKELSEIMRKARAVGYDVFDYVASWDRLVSLGSVLHMMGFAAAYGIGAWMTFASSYVLAKALPRHQFGLVQSKIYPVYFRCMAYCVGAALIGHLLMKGKVVPGLNLTTSLAMILVNMLVLEPRATKVMHERTKKEKEGERGKPGNEASSRVVDSAAETAGRVSNAAVDAEVVRLSATLQRLNSYSSLLNVLTLASLTWHLVHLSQRLC